MYTAASLAALLLLGAEAETPKVHDDRLQLQLVAEAPQIVTPTGIAVDAQGRVLVIESNTHFRPKDYQGPEADRILVLEDFDPQSGRAGNISTFFAGTTHTMNLAVYHDGSVYVATRSEIFRLRDTNNDGQSDERTQIAHLETPGNYPHNGLSGFAFDFAGNVYFGFGENLGADYKLIGSDGKSLSGGGEGGNIYTCDPEGKNVRRVATGFWNPFHLCFDPFGRLFAVDNDPDSRPPCRLLHIVEGGDYGYRFRNGRKGTNPLTAWNGELPGTLPMVSGTGEAPSAILSYDSDNLPAEYRGDLLVTSWGDHRLERYRLQPRGASFGAEMTPVVSGGENFRPVGLALAPDGSLYFSDWVDKSYQLHGKGRVWRLSAKQPAKRVPPKDDWAALASLHGPTRDAAVRKLKGNRIDQTKLFRFLREASLPAVRASAARLLSPRDELSLDAGYLTGMAWTDYSPGVRLIATKLLATGSPSFANSTPSRGGLSSAHPQLSGLVLHSKSAEVQAALITDSPFGLSRSLLDSVDLRDPFLFLATSQGIRANYNIRNVEQWRGLRPEIRLAAAIAARRRDDQHWIPLILEDDDPQVQLVALLWIAEGIIPEYGPKIEHLLATKATTRQVFEVGLATLNELYGPRRDPKQEPRGDDFVIRALLNEKSSTNLRRFALRSLRPDHAQLTDELLAKLLSDESPEIRVDAIRTLRQREGKEQAKTLRAIAGDEKRPAPERAEAVVGLHSDDADDRKLLLTLAASSEGVISEEALRNLRGSELSDAERKQLGEKAQSLEMPSGFPPAKDVGAWLKYAEGEGDAAAGERLFFHGKVAACARCHEHEGRGQQIGPDLTTIGRTLSRERLVQSLVDPSREIAPQFTPFVIVTNDGAVKTGTYVGEEVDGTVRYADAAGKIFKVHPRDLEERKPSRVSIMPDKLAEQLTQQELRDLLAFLLK